MREKTIFIMFTLLSIAFQPMNADNKIKNPETEWDDENDRSLPSAPQLSIDEQNLYVRSAVELTNLDVCIRDSRGNIVYAESHYIPADGIAVVPVASFNQGEYTLFINEGSKYVIATIIINPHS